MMLKKPLDMHTASSGIYLSPKYPCTITRYTSDIEIRLNGNQSIFEIGMQIVTEESKSNGYTRCNFWYASQSIAVEES